MACVGADIHTCDTRLRIQETNNPFFDLFRKPMTWLLTDSSPPTLLKELAPQRIPLMWWYNRKIRAFLVPHVKRAIAQRETGEGPKTIVKLAVKAYKEETSPKTASDSDFIDAAVSQLKIFILAGHDTTASALCYALYLLHGHPDCLQKARAELDQVLGPDLATSEQVISEQPQLLNALPYLQAVIKEVLRLFPPVGGIRKGGPDLFLVHPESGTRFPTDRWMLFANSTASHRWEKNCDDPHSFKPERWLGDEPPMPKNAYRPFEHAPRNCIGQELAQVELRAILALVLREFDMESAYDPNGPRIFGELAWQKMVPGDLTGKPVHGMPMRVKSRV